MQMVINYDQRQTHTRLGGGSKPKEKNAFKGRGVEVEKF